MYIIIAIIAFGFLIAIHELGHFVAAKLCGVRVNEFAIGMGPAILKKQGKETLYALRLLPIGGFCAMEGEDGDSEDPRAFSSQARWKRLIILAAGAFMNFLVGFIVVIILCMQMHSFVGTTITDLADGFPNAGADGLMVGDTIVALDGERLYYSSDFSTFIARDTDGQVDLEIIRNGDKIQLEDFPLEMREYTDADGQTRLRYGITFNSIEGTFGQQLKYSTYTTMNFVRLIRVSLSDLFHGAVGLKDLSGPVGIVSVINDVGNASAEVSDAISNIAYLFAFIAVNLAVMNMLPLPALDGGRIFFLIVTWIIERISRRRLNPKYEGYIHAAGLVLLMGLMVVVMISDVVKIING
jgi:regulator of sigma E protease